MICKKTLAKLLMSFSFFSMLGCSEYLNEKKKQPEVLNFSNEKMACLKDIPLGLKNISEGNASANELKIGFECIANSLVYFKNETFGAVPNQYSSEEISNFFNKYFLKQNQLTPEFSRQLMNLKKALLGGSDGYITKDEIAELTDFINILKDESMVLLPHVKVLLEKQETATWTEITVAGNQVSLSLKKIFAKTQLVKSDYSLDDFKKILLGLSDFLNESEAQSFYETSFSKIRASVPLLEGVKNILLGRTVGFVNQSQWNQGLESLVKAYELHLKHRYIVSSLKMKDADHLKIATDFIDQVISLLEQSKQLQSQGIIPQEDIDSALDVIFNSTGAGDSSGIQASSVKKIYRVIAQRIFTTHSVSDGSFVDDRSFVGIEKKHLAGLRREFKIWKMNQSFIDSMNLKQAHQGIKVTSLIDSMKSFSDRYFGNYLKNENLLEQAALRASFGDFKQLISQERSVNFNTQGRLVITKNLNQHTQSWTSLTKINMNGALARLLMLGYGRGNGSSMAETVLSEKGLIAWYDDFIEIGVDLKIFDSRRGNNGSATFIEAKSFTFNASKAETLNYNELYEYLGFLFGAGSDSSTSLQEDLGICKLINENKNETKDSDKNNELDVFGNVYLKEDCVRTQIRNNYASYFNNLPDLVQYMSKLDEKEFVIFFDYLKLSSLIPEQQHGQLETQNIRSMVMVLHYLESLMLVYDKNNDQRFSLDEIYAAAPHFQEFLKKRHPSKFNFILKEGFAYLVLNGHLPSASQLATFEVRKYFLPAANRTDVLRIFSILKE